VITASIAVVLLWKVEKLWHAREMASMMTIKMLGFGLVRKKEEEDGETTFEVKRKYDLSYSL
jgi:hypothetical protein